jgi:hypothetical protein
VAQPAMASNVAQRTAGRNAFFMDAGKERSDDVMPAGADFSCIFAPNEVRSGQKPTPLDGMDATVDRHA